MSALGQKFGSGVHLYSSPLTLLPCLLYGNVAKLNVLPPTLTH